MKPDKPRTPIKLAGFLIGGYVLAIIILFYFNVLEPESFLLISTSAIGWLIALIIAIVHLNRAREDSQEAKEYEIKKKLEIEAYKDVNKAINYFSDKISIVSTFFLTFPNKLKNHKQNPALFKLNIAEIDQEIWKIRVDLYQGNTTFLLSIEANEIAIIEYDYLRKYINFLTNDLYKLIDDFISCFIKDINEALESERGFLKFKKKCDDLFEFAQEITCYLFDYRIVLMNSILEEIFGKSVPHRKPIDPKCKILTEVAIKEEVEKEQKKRELAAIKKNNNNTI